VAELNSFFVQILIPVALAASAVAFAVVFVIFLIVAVEKMLGSR